VSIGKISFSFLILAVSLIALSAPAFGQQKGQWVPGQFGLNAGAIPDPGITYANLAVNYSAGQLNDSSGNPRTLITGNYSFWVDENIFYYVPKHKFLGGYFMPYIALNFATGSLVADITPPPPIGPPGTNLTASGGGSGFADMFVEPLNMGWHFGKRVDFNAGYGFTAPTGRYTAGASNNVGSGYWGNDITSGTTLYITKNQATTANLATAWEIHGQRTVASIPGAAGQTSNITPGQAFTMEWGLGQVLPLKKDFSRLLQIGLVGYDQWQVSSNGGNYMVAGLPVPANLVPYYSVHGIGGQANFILPKKNFVAFIKGYDEYRALARVEGRTIVFGFSYTFKFPKEAPPPPPPGPPTASCSGMPQSVFAGSNAKVAIRANASDPAGGTLSYKWTATGGNVEGSGPEVQWDSAGLAAGTYRVAATVANPKGATANCEAEVRVEPRPNRPPTIACAANPASIFAGERSKITCDASDPDGDPLTYGWRANAGQITGSGPSGDYDSTGLSPGTYSITTRVDDGRGGAADATTSVAVKAVPPAPMASKISECAFDKPLSARIDNVCKRILDDVALRLQNEPRATAVIIGYSDPKERNPEKVSGDRGANAVKYLGEKGIDASRTTTRTGSGQAGADQQNRRIDVVWVPEGASY
jgi:outer membrane protein OmpA-like peptidoglycan-associated protein